MGFLFFNNYYLNKKRKGRGPPNFIIPEGRNQKQIYLKKRKNLTIWKKGRGLIKIKGGPQILLGALKSDFSGI
jgi:hypothetical protein